MVYIIDAILNWCFLFQSELNLVLHRLNGQWPLCNIDSLANCILFLLFFFKLYWHHFHLFVMILSFYYDIKAASPEVDPDLVYYKNLIRVLCISARSISFHKHLCVHHKHLCDKCPSHVKRNLKIFVKNQTQKLVQTISITFYAFLKCL